MRVYNKILSNLRESSAFDELLRQLQRDSEMFDENMMNDEDDVFGGTEDSYANEMLDQQISDTIFYNELFSGKEEDYDLLTNIINEVIDYIREGNAITEEWLKSLLDKYGVSKGNMTEGELHTVENDPLWAKAVAKVNKEYKKNKPKRSTEIEKEYKKLIKDLESIGISGNQLESVPEVGAYKDAIEDPDDIWCECGNINSIYKPDGESYLGVDKHGYICSRCRKFQQIG